ncbi:glycosyltransferase involved in cell wall biosynthesis [Salinibacterium sp. CAN_S4]|uniref:glycosyltransferase n=1 Tax=Salinibacterium sp. CAN_S4 TaxID=2787727 RepID=UPI0018EFBD61
MTTGPFRGRVGGAMSAFMFGIMADATSLLPPKWRYAYVHPITRKLLPRQLGVVGASSGAALSTPRAAGQPASIICAIVTDKLDVGGIGSVVETLAIGLSEFGVRPVIVCQGDGARAQRLRDAGVRVISVADGTIETSAVIDAGADVVQVHSAPPVLEQAAIDSGLPVVAVLHNTEIHYSRRQWIGFAALYSHASSAIAVSHVVREFHRHRLSPSSEDRFVVIPNGSPNRPLVNEAARRAARVGLSETVGQDLTDAVVFICLARYDAQKNIAGTVSSFLRAVDSTDLPLHLVIAGDPSDWVELRRADGIRRRSRHRDRVHLLGQSDARSLLDAGDGFVLDSFFEGWPVAATEALEAGLPLVLSDVGGAVELVGRDPARSIVVPNATGPAVEVTDSRVGWARWRSGRQPNAKHLATAIVRVAERVVLDRESGRAGVPPIHGPGVREMVRAHAELLLRAARPDA